MSLQRPVKETVYNGRDNTVALQFHSRQVGTENETPLDFSDVTRVVIELVGLGVVLDENSLGIGSTVSNLRGNGWLDFALGALGVAAGEYIARIWVYRGAGDSVPTQIAHEDQKFQQVILKFVN